MNLVKSKKFGKAVRPNVLTTFHTKFNYNQFAYCLFSGLVAIRTKYIHIILKWFNPLPNNDDF